jgi:hypothetical protein
MAAEIMNSILGGSNGVYLIVGATEMKEAFREFVRIMRESEEERRAYDDEMATVTREDAIQIFNRSYSTLLRWEKDGYLVPVKIGKTPLYKMSDIKKVLNQKFNDDDDL